MALEQLLFAVEHADAGRAIELVAGEDVEVAIEVLHIDRHVHGAWQPSTSTGMPRACAMRITSLIGTMVPSTFDMWVMATILVRGVSSASNSSSRNSPSSEIGAHFRTAPLPLAQEVPGHDVGVVLHDGEHDLVALADMQARQGAAPPD